MTLPPPTIQPDLNQFSEQRKNSPYTVLCGSNNSGKSYILKNLKARLGKTSYMIGANRFYHVVQISSYKRDPSEYVSWDHQFTNQLNNPEHNYENNFIDLGRILANLSDKKRNALFELCGRLIGATFSLKRFEPDNELSMAYVDMDGQNLSVGSTGTRLLMTTLGLCMDETFDTILIDEPELGLSPRIQAALAEFFSNKSERDKYFPNLKSICVATHSHLMLDRKAIKNNFVVHKADNNISIEQVDSFTKLHNLQFNLLGNTLEALFLPSGFLLIEGKTDQAYLEKWLQLKLPERNILLTQTLGDPKAKVHILREALGDIFKSPMRTRIFAVLDSVHTQSDVAAMVGMGVLRDNIVIWNKNGIEYLYPPEIMANIFACSEEDLAGITQNGDEFNLNGVTKKKNELATEVTKLMTSATVMPAEIESKLFSKLLATLA